MSLFINLENKTFQVDPDLRFSQFYGVPRGVLNEICGIQEEFFLSQKRATMMVDYFNKKYGKNISLLTFWKWRNRRKLYLMTVPLRRKKLKAVSIEWFGDKAKFLKDIQLHCGVRNRSKSAEKVLWKPK